MNADILRKAGLSTNEIKIYIALLELGSVTAGSIIKKTEVHRAGVYDTLERLADKGLVSYVIRANRKYFEAASPDVLIDVIEKKEEKLKEDKNIIQKALPALDALRFLSKESQEVTLFKGFKGVQSVLDHMLSQKEFFIMGGGGKNAAGLRYASKFILPKWHKARIRKKIRAKFIFPMQSKERAYALKNLPHTQIRILNSEFDSVTGIQIYGDFVSLILWSKNPIAILIRSKEIASSYKDYFSYLWNQSQKT